MNDRIKAARESYFAARFEYERENVRAKRLLAVLRDEMRDAERSLVEAMMDADVRNWTDSDGVRVQFRPVFGISVTKENTDAIRAWLLETEGDDMPYVEEKVNKAQLTELVKRIAEERGTDEIPEFLNCFRETGIAVTGWEQKAKASNKEQ